jgi:predicted CopG family antitoxin
MATKTVSVTIEAYDKLRRARRYSSESFTQVILRATWPEDTITAAELLSRLDRSAAPFTAEELDAIESAKTQQREPDDKWTDR